MRLVLLALTIVLSLFPVVLAGIPAEHEYLFAKVVLFLGDLPALALLLATLPRLGTALGGRPRLRPATCWAALIAIEAAAFAVHPAAEGVQELLRLGTTLAVIVTVAALRAAERPLIVGALAAAAAVQTGIALLQIARGGPIGLTMLGETTDPLVTAGNVGAVVAPEGTVLHPHILASLALLAGTIVLWELVRRGPAVPWALGAFIALLPAGLSFARAAAVGAAAAALALARGALAGRPRARLALAVLILATALPLAARAEGWLTRAEVGLDSSRRDVLAAQAGLLIAAQPLTGVGPGRQLIALRELAARDPDAVSYLNAVHDVPLTVTVEAGVIGGAIAVLLLVVTGLAALRAGGPALALFAAYLPFVLLDHFPFTHQHGLVLTGLWLGFLERGARGED